MAFHSPFPAREAETREFFIVVQIKGSWHEGRPKKKGRRPSFHKIPFFAGFFGGGPEAAFRPKFAARSFNGAHEKGPFLGGADEVSARNRNFRTGIEASVDRFLFPNRFLL